MGFFDGFVDEIYLRKDSTGKTLFYPHGILGSGFFVESDSQKTQIRSYSKKTILVMLPTLIVIQMTVGLGLSLPLFLAFAAWCYFAAKKITKGMPKSAEKVKLSEAYKRSAQSYNLAILILLDLAVIGFIATAFWAHLGGPKQPVALAANVFLGLCGVAIGCMIWAKIRSNYHASRERQKISKGE